MEVISVKKPITIEQKTELVNLANEGHRDAIIAFSSERWNNGYNYGVLVTGIGCLISAGMCFAYDWLRTRD